jgi:hypothetical protein
LNIKPKLLRNEHKRIPFANVSGNKAAFFAGSDATSLNSTIFALTLSQGYIKDGVLLDFL